MEKPQQANKILAYQGKSSSKNSLGVEKALMRYTIIQTHSKWIIIKSCFGGDKMEVARKKNGNKERIKPIQSGNRNPPN
jgi:hypothetical protein